MAIDIDRTALDLDEMLPGVVLVAGLDDTGRITDDPTAAVEGELLISFRDGTTRQVCFSRSAPLPAVRVAP